MSALERRAAWPRALGLLLLTPALAFAAPPEDPQRARAFEVRYRELSDAADVVSPLLSPEGTLTLRPRLRTLVVQDRVSVLERVASLLESFDLPPKNVEITLSLFLGSDRRVDEERPRAASASFSEEVRGVLETLGDFTRWTAYEPLGSRSVVGVEGDEMIANLSERYRVLFLVESVHEAQGVIKLKRFVLQRLEPAAAGIEPVVETLYSGAAVLKTGRLHVVGAASGPDSKQALFLTLQARAR